MTVPGRIFQIWPVGLYSVVYLRSGLFIHENRMARRFEVS